MRPPIRRFLTLSLTGLLAAASLVLAEEKTYNISGPVTAIDANTISLTQGKGKEKSVIRRTSSTQTTGALKPGDISQVEFFMTATSIAPKGTKTNPPAGEKIYHVSGPIFGVDANTISLTQGKGTEKYVIARGPGTQTIGSFKVGDIVRVGYFMTATNIGLKEAAKPGAAVPAVGPVVPRVAPAATVPAVTTPTVTAPSTQSVPNPPVSPPKAASIPATAAASPATPPAAPDAAPAASPAKKTKKPKKAAATDPTKAGSTPDAPVEATPAPKAGKSKAAKAGDRAAATSAAKPEATPAATPAKKIKKTKKQKADEAAAAAAAASPTPVAK